MQIGVVIGAVAITASPMPQPDEAVPASTEIAVQENNYADLNPFDFSLAEAMVKSMEEKLKPIIPRLPTSTDAPTSDMESGIEDDDKHESVESPESDGVEEMKERKKKKPKKPKKPKSKKPVSAPFIRYETSSYCLEFDWGACCFAIH